MSLLDVLNTLNRIHNARGQLTEVQNNVRIFQNARNFRPNSRDDWDLLNNRDDNLKRIARVVTRVARTTRRLSGATGTVTNHSRQLSTLFGRWAQAYADSGPDSRAAEQAETAFVVEMLRWNEELGDGERDAPAARRRLGKMKEFYDAQADLFGTLKSIAERFVRHWPNSAQQAQALAWMLDFETIANKSQQISRNLGDGISASHRWSRNLTTARRELTTWMNWMRNANQRDRSLSTGRAPR